MDAFSNSARYGKCDRPLSDRDEGVALALSGGGYRAALFHLGALIRLNELGYLSRLAKVTSVSGGSVTGAMLGYRWKTLKFDDTGVARNLNEEVIGPVMDFCSRTMDLWAILKSIALPWKLPGDFVSSYFRCHLLGDARLTDLPGDGEGPKFTIYSTNLLTGVSFRFTHDYVADYRIGRMTDTHKVRLSDAVTASLSFAPILSPMVLKGPWDWQMWDKGGDMYNHPGTGGPQYLADGGVYDNMGLESVWDRYKTVLVSDAGAPFAGRINRFAQRHCWLSGLIRTVDITTEQTRALRKRKLLCDYRMQRQEGTYWGIATDIDDYELPDAMVRDSALTRSLSTIRTRLNRFSPEEQGRLINWGYALADAGMRRWVLGHDPGPGTWPEPGYPLS